LLASGVAFFFRYLILIVFVSIAAVVALLSRSGWGKRFGVSKLGVIGYLLFLVFLYWIAVVPSSSDSMGYAIVPLAMATFPWGLIIAGLPYPLPSSQQAVLMLFAGGGLNCFIFFLLFVRRDRKTRASKVSR
jgi:hypothetical protein